MAENTESTETAESTEGNDSGQTSTYSNESEGGSGGMSFGWSSGRDMNNGQTDNSTIGMISIASKAAIDSLTVARRQNPVELAVLFFVGVALGAGVYVAVSS